MPHQNPEQVNPACPSRRDAGLVRARRFGQQALLQMLLGGLLALVATFAFALSVAPRQSAPAAVGRLVLAQQWASTPLQSTDQDDVADVADVADVDDDETNLTRDDVAPCDLPLVFAFGVVLSSRSPRVLPGELPVGKSRLAMGPHLARGPPALGRTVAV